MCGIAGIINGGRNARTQAIVSAIGHRGPEDSGVWKKDAVTLIHSRLRILDLSEAGHQPMTRGSLAIVFNGEIYNFLELRRILEAEGVRFSSSCDTEVILMAYERWGVECVQRLHGMFAF